ncbi:hypothetical protein AB0L42_43195 [Streptomyces sp. NPDC052287]|uniref:hypothetical protein n=1 Tax=Streptomyces sp. NPDC052287 TaxID=3154950 RepID=UPI00343F4595
MFQAVQEFPHGGQRSAGLRGHLLQPSPVGEFDERRRPVQHRAAQPDGQPVPLGAGRGPRLPHGVGEGKVVTGSYGWP